MFSPNCFKFKLISSFSYSLKQSDIIVVSCDLLTTVDIKYILNFHRKNDASLTALYFEPNADLDLPFTTPGPKSKNKPGKSRYC